MTSDMKLVVKLDWVWVMSLRKKCERWLDVSCILTIGHVIIHSITHSGFLSRA